MDLKVSRDRLPVLVCAGSYCTLSIQIRGLKVQSSPPLGNRTVHVQCLNLGHFLLKLLRPWGQRWMEILYTGSEHEKGEREKNIQMKPKAS